MAAETPEPPESTESLGSADAPETSGTPETTESSEAVRKQDGRWSTCCGVVAVVLVLLVGLGAWGISELEKGLDGEGQLEGSSDSLEGSYADPLAAGSAASYEDGLKVTVGAPRREADGRAYRIDVTYENDTDETVRPGGPTAVETVSEYEGAPLVVRPGESLDDGDPEDGSDSDWFNSDQAAAKLMTPLREDDSLTVPVRVKGDTKGMAVTVEVSPPDDGFRDTAYWQLTLP